METKTINIKVNENNEITAYASIGGVGGIDVSDDILPENFMTDFKRGYFLYKDGKITVNPDFEPSHEIE